MKGELSPAVHERAVHERAVHEQAGYERAVYERAILEQAVHKQTAHERVVHEFAPVYDGASRILILGTFPSVRSREQHFYYGHPQNRFWKVLAALLKTETPGTFSSGKQDRRLGCDRFLRDRGLQRQLHP